MSSKILSGRVVFSENVSQSDWHLKKLNKFCTETSLFLETAVQMECIAYMPTIMSCLMKTPHIYYTKWHFEKIGILRLYRLVIILSQNASVFIKHRRYSWKFTSPKKLALAGKGIFQSAINASGAAIILIGLF